MSFSRSLKNHAEKVWEEAYQHPFVQGLGKGTLEKEKFQFYLLQDYQYLMQYAKVYALAATKAHDEEILSMLTQNQYYIFVEAMNVHKDYCKGFGISHADMLKAKSSLYNRVYTSFMLGVGATGDLAEILVSVFPCAWTYADFARRLKVEYKENLEKNFYRTWIENYAGEEFYDGFQWFYDAIDKLVESKSDEERQRLIDIFISSVEFEYLFWDMAYKMEMGHRL